MNRIERSKMPKIDISRPVKTRDGKRIVGLIRVPTNSTGRTVTYPLKGSVIMREKPLKMEYCIWSDEGLNDVVWGYRPELDLIQE